MPQVIPFVFYAAAGIFTTYAVALTIAAVISSLALSEYQRKKASRAAQAQYDSSFVDRLTNVPAVVAQRELVLGRVRKGGNVFFRGSSGQYKQTFSMCIALAAHEIDGVELILFDGQVVDVDGDGNVTTAPWARTYSTSVRFSLYATSIVLDHTPVSGSLTIQRIKGDPGGGDVDSTAVTESVPYTLSGTTLTIAAFDSEWTYTVDYQYSSLYSVANVRWHLGAAGQAADGRLMINFPGVWTAAHRCDGIAYLVVEFLYDERAMPKGLPVVTAQIRGAKIYDPRTGLGAFSECPALMMRYVMAHPQFGKRTSFSAAEDARIVAAANACEAGFNYGGGTVSKFRAAIVVQFGAATRDVLDDLAQSMGGQWAYAAGELFMRAGVYQAGVATLTDADLAVVQRGADGSVSQSPISISTHRARNDKVNSVVARIWDQAAGYIQTPIMPMRIDSYVAADGAELVQEVTMPAVFYAYQAFGIAAIMLRDGRDPLTVTLPFKMTTYALELFDGVYLTLARYGWTNKEFQILGRQMQPDGSIQLTLKETAVGIYNLGNQFLPSGYASNSTLPRPWEITPPSITSITSGESDLVVQSDGTIVDAVRVTWLPIQDAPVIQGGFVEVQYLLPSETEWRGVTVPGGQVEAVLIGGFYDNAIILVRARTRSSLAISDWSTQISHQVIGKIDPPPDIDFLSIAGSVLSWTMPRRVPDLAGFIFRFHYGNHLDWNSATPMHTGVITQSPFDLVTRPPGVVTIMGKAIDTSGNESLNTANIVMNLGDILLANVVEQLDFEATGWAYDGALGWTLVLGKPTANSLDSFYGTDNQSFYGDDTLSFFDASSYAEMIYITKPVAITKALSGSLMTLVVGANGTDLRIEYRLAGPDSFYGPDGASFYDPDPDSLYGLPGPWQPWPGQIVAARDVYQFRVTLGAGPVQSSIQNMVLTIDAPDIVEQVQDLAIAAGGTTVPHTKPFTVIKTVQATLQANASGAVTLIVDKATLNAPVIHVYNAAFTGVAGATADVVLQGY